MLHERCGKVGDVIRESLKGSRRCNTDFMVKLFVIVILGWVNYE